MIVDKSVEWAIQQQAVNQIAKKMMMKQKRTKYVTDIRVQ